MDLNSVSPDFLFKKKGPILESFQVMGIVNLTPDSFSDGNDNDPRSVQQRIAELNLKFLDFGAQSTAPQNNSIGESEELSRWKNNYSNIEEKLEQIETFSIDTYWPKVFKEVYDHFSILKPSLKFIWNDVSGILDQETIEVLKDCPQADYVYCHCHVPSRDQVNNHMEFCQTISESEFAKEVMNYFKDADIKLAKHDLSDRAYYDPAFGFSKTMEQNYILLKNLWWVIKKFPYERKWLIGISRKSFLKNMLNDMEDSGFSLVHGLEQNFYFHWMNQLSQYGLTFRVHRPEYYYLAKSVYQKVLA